LKEKFVIYVLLIKIELKYFQLRESKQQCDEYSKKIVNQNADILLLSSSTERVKMLEIENQQMKIIKEQRESELLRQIRHLHDDKEELQKKLDGKKIFFVNRKFNF
jgi:hypothetical protein